MTKKILILLLAAALVLPAVVSCDNNDSGDNAAESWHQCPEAVRHYIASVDYTGVAYTKSSVRNYAPTPADPETNTKPVGKTVDGVTYYNNVPKEKIPFSSENGSGTFEPLDQVRWIKSKTSNMRDLGGWDCDGGTVKYGMLYRSGELSPEDEDLFITELGITAECDLTADGVPAFPDKMDFIGHTSYAMYTLSDPEAWKTNLGGIFDAVIRGDPVVFHCSMGADRTGTLACVLEGLLGVSQSDCDKDYELTSFYTERARNKNYQGGTADWAHLIEQIEELNGASFRDKCVTFALSLGFSADDINAYRHAMIDGDPEDISTFTVTNALTGCSTDNPATFVGMNDDYHAVITADRGYSMTGVEVNITMNGTDITSTAYADGEIKVQGVNGSIVITIAAAEITAYPNQITISTDEDGNPYDQTGYKDGVRLNSSGAEVAFTDGVVTGYIPFKLGDRILFDRFDGTESSNGGICYFDANHAVIAYTKFDRLIDDGVTAKGQPLDYTPPSAVHDGGSGKMISIENAAYIRISCKSSDPSSLVCGIIGGSSP